MSRLPKILQSSTRKKNLTVVKSPLDRRDHRLKLLNFKARLPTSINLRGNLPFVYNQGRIGSCTANSAGSMYSWVVRSQSGQTIVPSRLFLYYNTRLSQGTVGFDSGASLRATMTSLKGQGVCPETMWPYLYENLFQKPGDDCYTDGLNRQALSYASVPISLVSMKNILVNRPFIIGILVYSSFFHPNVARTGQVPVPNVRNETLMGGHAILVMGYDDRKKSFYCRNSWGTDWGLKGDFYLPYNYATNPKLAFDAWVLYSAENPLVNTRVIKR